MRGGVVVHVGSGAGAQTAALAREGRFLVQGLEQDRKRIDQARQHATELDLAGQVTFKRWQGGRLPYTDNLVNVLFWDESAGEPDRAEILRVLAPRGVAFIADGTPWRRLVKPWPDDIDEWPHQRYNAGNAGASNDARSGPPNHVQWEAGPRFMRSHELEAGVAAIVSAGGRLYYVIDEGLLGITDARFPAQWTLVCRDAFNGVLLWTRPLPGWGWQGRGALRGNRPEDWHGWIWRSPSTGRLLAADGHTVYTTLSWGGPVSALDAATGEILRTFEHSDGTTELIVEDGTLVVRRDGTPCAVAAYRTADGKQLWQRDSAVVLEQSLCMAEGRVFYHNRAQMVALDRDSGQELWRQQTNLRPGGLIAHRDTVLAVQQKLTLALDAATGEERRLYHRRHGAGERAGLRYARRLLLLYGNQAERFFRACLDAG